jgi:hypothetical protein
MPAALFEKLDERRIVIKLYFVFDTFGVILEPGKISGHTKSFIDTGILNLGFSKQTIVDHEINSDGENS